MLGIPPLQLGSWAVWLAQPCPCFLELAVGVWGVSPQGDLSVWGS